MFDSSPPRSLSLIELRDVPLKSKITIKGSTALRVPGVMEISMIGIPRSKRSCCAHGTLADETRIGC